ncbi:MAG: tRNA uridine-5-carboxymethylaminomethyl(34) synthesis GTPase MnmE [Pseudomonadota bacterium]|nr:tRNA uridine-5-carboxymethylaminomethyl(34) synthesis GTPase MnmE [Candidatus Pelagibacter sp.]MEC8074216.1 tRNA uridine-5-carboxymethylaminomethyl(34) synthesis GTPase MnmE [Pseudomonadota bacterium]
MTIYALSSGPGIAGISVIRVSGSKTKDVIINLTQQNLPEPRVATLRKFNNINNNELIDEGILIWFPGPNSYTGEDMAEFHVHGSKAVVNSIQATISKIDDCRLADPGEFTKIAFQNGKINLLKAESISDLISSETEIQRQQAIKIMSGKSSEKFNSLRSRLIKILSNVEAKIDFPEDDLPNDILENIHIETDNIKNEIEKIINDQRVGERIREGFKIAIVGPTNAGKSSLLNYLSRREIAIVSEIAGTTRDVIEAHLNLDGFPVILSDTAGIRVSKDEIEKKGIKLALEKAENADLNIIVIEPKSTNFKDFFKEITIKKAILVVNKSDLGVKEIGEEVKKYKPIFISVKEEKNLNKLINLIKESLKDKFISSEDVYITRERHRSNLKSCVEHLKNFQEKKSLQDFDKGAEDLRLAARYLGMIVGKVDVEEVLGSIFNDFCIGK